MPFSNPEYARTYMREYRQRKALGEPYKTSTNVSVRRKVNPLQTTILHSPYQEYIPPEEWKPSEPEYFEEDNPIEENKSEKKGSNTWVWVIGFFIVMYIVIDYFLFGFTVTKSILSFPKTMLGKIFPKQSTSSDTLTTSLSQTDSVYDALGGS